MEGNIYLDDPAIGKVVASNLTSGKGGVGSAYTDQDWARAIRHGIRPDGTPLLFMPSTEFYFLSDEDLGAVIAYIKSAPPVDHELPPSSVSWTGRVVMTLVPAITFIPAELIPHAAPRPVRARSWHHAGVWRISDLLVQGLSRADDVWWTHPGLSIQLASRTEPDVRRRLCPANLDGGGFYQYNSYRRHS